MTNSKQTKRALLSSVMALLLCFTMLLGTTFAWFTDTASTSVNTIQAGTLDVMLEMWNGQSWVDASGETLSFTENYWEPGCTYSLPELRIRNNGNLALKYKVVITGIKGDAELNKAIDWTIDGMVMDHEYVLNAEATQNFTISGHMKESAGNEYMGKKIEGISITVYATQYTYENDSIDDQYDKDAAWGTKVESVEDLKKALAAGENVVFNADIDTNEVFEVTGDTVINLNGHNVKSTYDKGVFMVRNGAKLTVSGSGTVSGNYVFKVDEGGELVINSGNFESTEFAVTGLGGKITINGGTFTTEDNVVIGTNGTTNQYPGSTITINGGTFDANIKTSGYMACGVFVANNDTVVINGGTFNVNNGIGVFARLGNVTVGKDVVFNVNNTDTTVSGKIGSFQLNNISSVIAYYEGATVTNNGAYTASQVN